MLDDNKKYREIIDQNNAHDTVCDARKYKEHFDYSDLCNRL